MEKTPSRHGMDYLLRQGRRPVGDFIDCPRLQEPPCSRKVMPQIWLQILESRNSVIGLSPSYPCAPEVFQVVTKQKVKLVTSSGNSESLSSKK